MQRVAAWITAIASCALTCAPAAAQTARSGGNACTQLVQQMQQLASERTTLQAENDKLKAQIATLTKERDGLKTGQQTLERRAKDESAALARSGAQNTATEQELTQTKAKMQELIGKFRETIQKFHEVEAEDTAAKQTLAAREHELSVCADRNVALYQLNNEVLTRLANHGVFSRLAETEPFTQIKRAENESLVDGYRERARELQVKPPAAATAPGAASQPAPPARPAASSSESGTR